MRTFVALALCCLVLASCDVQASPPTPPAAVTYVWGYVAQQDAPDAGYRDGTLFVCLATNRAWLRTSNGWLFLGTLPSVPERP